MSKIDLFRKEWLDVVFENKNKSCGAYRLRQNNASTTTKATLMASAAFILLFLTPNIISLIKGQMPEEVVEQAVEVAIQPPPPVDPKTPPPPPLEPPPPKQDQVKFPPPIVKPERFDGRGTRGWASHPPAPLKSRS